MSNVIARNVICADVGLCMWWFLAATYHKVIIDAASENKGTPEDPFEKQLGRSLPPTINFKQVDGKWVISSWGRSGCSGETTYDGPRWIQDVHFVNFEKANIVFKPFQGNPSRIEHISTPLNTGMGGW